MELYNINLLRTFLHLKIVRILNMNELGDTQNIKVDAKQLPIKKATALFYGNCAVTRVFPKL